jgi:transaldolase
MTNLHKLKKIRQSPWYDNITRDLLSSGGLNKLIDKGILGLTSNPTIFHKAFVSSPLYKNQLEELKAKKISTFQTYEKLVFKDILGAADCFEDVYDSSGKIDGYVSIEVSPHYAYDTEKTIQEAERTFKALSCPNIMIKVPATKEGMPAIRKLVAMGININATLIFSISQYEKTANAYIEGLEKRASEGKDLSSINSVASVFVSRVDTKVDKILDEKGNNSLRGLAAVANAKIIYQKFKEIFYSERFKKLQEKGANLQRVLWASTSAKNPAYSKVKYVEELIGPDTVNTMPGETMDAFIQYGEVKVTVDENLEEAKRIIGSLKDEGISIDEVCEQLQQEGVKKFIDSFDALLDSIAKSIL